MKKFLVFITTLFIIFSLSSCKKNNEFKIDGEYIYQINYESYLNKKETLRDFVVFLADKNEEIYLEANQLINNYFKYYQDLDIYRLDISKDENNNFVDSTINENNYNDFLNLINQLNCNKLNNSLLIYNNGSPYRAINFIDLLDTNTPDLNLYDYINNLNNYAISIKSENDESINEVININKETAYNMIKEQKDFLILIGQSTCIACQNCLPSINNYIEKNHKKIYLLNIIGSDLKYIQENLNIQIIYTPTFITYKNGLVVNKYIGCYSSTQLNLILK